MFEKLKVGFTKDKESWAFTIFDSDFGEAIIVVPMFVANASDSAIDIDDANVVDKFITIYKAQKQPIAPNLAKFIVAFANGTHTNTNSIIDWARKKSPEFAEYDDLVHSYLMLL